MHMFSINNKKAAKKAGQVSKRKKQTTKMDPKVFKDLAKKNVKKSAKDYGVYFLTVTLAVCLFYTFNSIHTQFASFGVADTLNYLAFASGVMACVSVLVCVIMGFLVVYANRFLLKRRKKEIGVYYLLGMSQKDLNTLMMRESLLIGSGALAAGLLIGLVFAQILSLITGKIIGADLNNYHFMISPKSMLASILFFGLLFFVVHRFNIRELKKMELVDLLQAERKNETVIQKSQKKDVFTFLCSLILLIVGNGWMIGQLREAKLKTAVPGGVLAGIGVILFFLSLYGIVTRLMKKNRRYYYKGLHVITVNQLGSKKLSMGLSNAVISILLVLSFSLTSIGLIGGKDAVGDLKWTTPYDASLMWYPIKEAGLEGKKDILNLLNETGFQLKEYSKKHEVLNAYELPGYSAALFRMEQEKAKKYGNTSKYPVDVIGVKEYNRMLVLQGKEPITLKKNQYAINYNSGEAEETLKEYIQNPDKITLNHQTLTYAKHGLYRHSLYNKNVPLDFGTIIVPQTLIDEVKDSLLPSYSVVNLTFGKEKEKSYQKLMADGYKKIGRELAIETKQDVLLAVTSDHLVLTYLGTYLGLSFLITAGAVLALQQLSQTADYEKHYQLLKKMGARQEDMKKSVRAQLKAYFGVPYILALSQAGILLFSLWRVFARIPIFEKWFLGSMCFGFVTVVYLIYYGATLSGSKRILDL